jgi:orotidine-5'-phosphate decarboxylase
MLKAAGEAARAVNPHIKVIGVTVLTSLNEADLKSAGVAGAPGEQVVRLAQLAKANGLDGVVCSALEIATLRAALGPDFLLVVPGIRTADSDLNDQSRVMTPSEAHRAGADLLVIGRPITAAPDPVKAARDIAQSLGF